MAWVQEVEADEAEGLLAEMYAAMHGRMANILKSHSLNPEALQAHLQLYRTIMFGPSGLSRAEREAVATVVSTLNQVVAYFAYVNRIADGLGVELEPGYQHEAR